MIDLARRRLLAWGGTSAALGMLGGCESFYESRFLRNPVYDTGAADEASNASVAVEPPKASRPELPPLFDDIERRTFEFFWDNANPANGMVPDRYPSPSPASIAAIGMALTAYVIGADRHYVTREQARARTLTTVRFFQSAPQGAAARGMTGYKGFFYHFLDMKTGQRVGRSELSTVDTALLIGGMLHAQAYFDSDHPDEVEIRATVDAIYWRVDWKWAQVRGDFVSMGWKPESAFIPHDWQGYNEAMLVVLLALGSPTHPVGEGAWAAWTNSYKGAWGRFMGYEHLSFAPLFGHQYSHMWIDFRGIQDATMRERGIDYFENTRRAAYAQRAYAIANPEGLVRVRRERLGLHRLRRPRHHAPDRPHRALALLPRLLGARRRPRAHGRRRHDRAHRRRLVAAVRARDRDPRDRGDACALRPVHLCPVRLPRLVQPQLHRHRRHPLRRARRSRRSAGSRATISASTRGRSWR